MGKSSRTAAAALVETLQAAGVQRLFSLSGNQILSVYDACFDACLDAEMEIIHVRHEAAAVHMADAWGRLTEQPGVALLTAGPGHANGLSALYVAQQAESPVVLLSGHCPQSDLGRGGFQEMAQADMASPVVKASWTVLEPKHVARDVSRAWHIARSGRPGPVHVSLPGDILEAKVKSSGASRNDHDRPDEPAPLKAETPEVILTALSKAERPLVLAGPAMMRPSKQASLNRLADATGLPVVGMESPRGINDPSLGALAEMLPKADVVLLLGKKLDWSLRFGQSPAFGLESRFLQVDADAAVLKQTANVIHDRLQTAVFADPAAAVTALIEHAASVAWPKSTWSADVLEAIGYRPAEWSEVSPNTVASGDEAIHPAEVCLALRPWTEGDVVFVSDGGEFGQWAQAILSAKHRVINGLSGSIGGSIPFALAAKAAFPQSRVLVTLGDGTFGFHAMEFETAVRCGLPFVAVVGNDTRWNAEYQLQLRQYGAERTIGCELSPTRYDQVVRSLGGHGAHVTRIDELPGALDRAFHSGLPSCVNVAIRPEPAPVIRRHAIGPAGRYKTHVKLPVGTRAAHPS